MRVMVRQRGGGGIQTFQKSCKLNLLFVLILRDKCVVHFFFFLAKIEIKKNKSTSELQ